MSNIFFTFIYDHYSNHQIQQHHTYFDTVNTQWIGNKICSEEEAESVKQREKKKNNKAQPNQSIINNKEDFHPQ